MRSFEDKRPRRVITPLPTVGEKLKYSVIYQLARGELVRVDYFDEDLLAGYGWFVGKVGYALACFGRYDNRFLHQEVYRREHGDYDTSTHRIDHKNGNTLDNRLGNLRLSSVSENGLHRTKLNGNNVSGKTGVYEDKRRGKWAAEIFVDGIKHHLGRLSTFAEAVQARLKAESTYARGFESKT
jgi:hypothetical protein